VNSVDGPVLSFSGDGEEEDPAVDLFANADSEDDEAPTQAADDDDDEEGEDEPEDDFNAAWEVLDLARAIYDREIQQEEDDEVKLKLADTYIALGDVSLETGVLLDFHVSRGIDIRHLLHREIRSSNTRLRRRPEI